ncbi:MMPL family transporter [Sulfidibacter corallicola]|uniref:MMPL family transporter n=1 Tax=Sulfidibacter corallicola TaxID=2818388 RepID=A0A8A4TJS1_SULCO|nr:MMPL family transporter [Sulfidibacter corallicola]QTD49058.1 MMPL family transporter [Sulfidibacter corallicola]
MTRKTNLFESWANHLLRHRRKYAALILMLNVFFVVEAARHLVVDASFDNIMNKNAPPALALERFREEFGRDDMSVVLVEGDVFSESYLERLAALHGELADLNPDLASLRAEEPTTVQGGFEEFGEEGWGAESGGSIVDDIRSLINVEKTRLQDDTLEIYKPLDPLPDGARLKRAKAALLQDPNVVGYLVSPNADMSVLLIRTRPITEQESHQVQEEIEAILARYEALDFRLHTAGLPAINLAMSRLVTKDTLTLGGLSFVLIIFTMVFLHRRFWGVCAPLLLMIQTIMWTYGLMALLGIKVSFVGNILPGFLTCVAICDSVHFYAIFKVKRQKLALHEAIVATLGLTGKPIVFTSLTTMAGLLSFTAASTEIVGELGVSAALGVCSAMVLSLSFIPLFFLWDRKPYPVPKDGTQLGRMGRMLGWMSGLSDRRPMWIGTRLHWGFTLMVALFVVFGYGLSKLQVWHNPMAWIPADQPIRQGFDKIETNLSGTGEIELLVEAGAQADLRDLELLRRLDTLEAHLKKWPHPENGAPLVRSAVSPLNILRETHATFHGGGPESFALADTQAELDDMLLLFENASPENLRSLVTDDFQVGHMSLRLSWMEATSYMPFRAYLEDGIEQIVGDLAEVRPTGNIYNLVLTVSQLIFDLIKSFSFSLLFVGMMLLLFLKDLRLGLIALVPNLTPVLLTFGTMGFLGIPLDLSNILIASITIGLAVDDTIHFMHHFRIHFREFGDVERAIRYTLEHSGPALVSTTFIIALGHVAYFAGTIVNVKIYGGLIMVTVIFALLSDVLLGPILLRTFCRNRQPADAPVTPVETEAA